MKRLLLLLLPCMTYAANTPVRHVLQDDNPFTYRAATLVHSDAPIHSGQVAANHAREARQRVQSVTNSVRRGPGNITKIVQHCINGVNLAQIPTRYRDELMDYAYTVNTLAFKGKGRELREMLEAQKRLFTASNPDQRLVAMAKARMIVNMYNTDLIQAILIIGNDTIDNAREKFIELSKLHDLKQIDDVTWAEIEEVYYGRAEHVAVVDPTTMTVSTHSVSAAEYKTMEELKSLAIRELTVFELLSVDSFEENLVAQYICKHIAATYLMVHEKGTLTLEEFYESNKAMIDRVITAALIAKNTTLLTVGVGEAAINFAVPQVKALFAPAMKAGQCTAIVVSATLKSMFGNHKDFDMMCRKIDSFTRDAVDMFNNDPRQAGRHIGNAIIGAAYTMYKSDNPDVQANIAAAKKIIGVSKAASNLWWCNII